MFKYNNRRLLLVEDEALIAMAKKRELLEYGYDIIHAMTGEDAVSKIRSDNDIDLILMDIDLGVGIDGTEAAEIILKDREIPIVFLSSHTEPEIVSKTENIRSYGYVVKSANISVLDSSIKAAIELFNTNINKSKEIKLLEYNYKNASERETDLNTILTSFGDAVMTSDTEGKVVRINDVAENLTGWDKHRIKNNSVSEVLSLINAQDNGPAMNPVNRVLESERIEEIPDNTVLISKDGRKYQISGISIPIRNDIGNITRVVTVFREVSEDYQLKKELKKHDSRYKFAVEGSALGLWDWNIKTKNFILSAQARAILGVGRDSFSINIDDYAAMLHPDDRKYFRDNIYNHLADSTTTYQDEYRIQLKDGKCNWILSRGMIVSRFENGKPSRMIGTFVDVTKRRQAEENLRIERDNFINIFNSMKDGVFIVNQEHNINYLNPALQKDFGAFLGQKCYEYLYKRTEECPWCNLTRVTSGEKVNEEIVSQINHKTYDLIGTSITNTHHTISMLCILRDITARKEAEQELKVQLQEKEVLLKEVHHRIKNNFSSIAGLLSMQAGALTDSVAVSALNDAISRVKSYQILYEKLLLSDNYNVTSVKQYIGNLVDDIFKLGFNSEDIAIKIDKKIDDFEMSPKDMVSFGIIVNELLTNVLKYSFTGRESGFLHFTVSKHNSDISLIIQDDGNGLPEDFNLRKNTGFGLLLVQMLVKQFNGDFIIENNNGTRSIINFSIKDG